MKKKGRAPQRIGGIVESVLAEHGYLTICREHDILRRWGELVGERIAGVTECSRVENGTLYVRVKSAAWRSELVYLKETLLAKLRAECASIHEIVFS